MKIDWKKLPISLLIPLLVGGLSAWITKDGMGTFAALKQPPLSPPGMAFPIVWSILFVLMGISFYLVWRSDAPAPQKQKAYIVYAVQLALNFFWSIIFFNMKAYGFAFGWLLLVWGSIIAMMVVFRKVSKTAAYLQTPYLLWVTFAGYLNLMIALLN